MNVNMKESPSGTKEGRRDTTTAHTRDNTPRQEDIQEATTQSGKQERRKSRMMRDVRGGARTTRRETTFSPEDTVRTGNSGQLLGEVVTALLRPPYVAAWLLHATRQIWSLIASLLERIRANPDAKPGTPPPLVKI